MRALRVRGLGELTIGSVSRRMLERAVRGASTAAAWPDARLAAVWEQFDQGTQRAVLRVVRAGGERARPRPPACRTALVHGAEDPWAAPAWWAEHLPHADAARARRRPAIGRGSSPRAAAERIAALLSMRRAAPTLLAAGLALAYVLISPPSLDLAAHLLRAKLFGAEGFGLWNNWWYGGHHVPGYSVLFPPLAWLLTPQLVAALACVGTAAAFEALAFERFGPDAWLGSLWFGAATASDLFTGRLTFAFGLLPAVLERARPRSGGVRWRRPASAALTALASPVAALFVALAAAAHALGPAGGAGAAGTASAARGGGRGGRGAAARGGAGGRVPGGRHRAVRARTACGRCSSSASAAVALFPARERVLRVGALLYLLGTLGSYLIASPVGGNAVRLAALVAGPLVAILWLRPHPRWLALVLRCRCSTCSGSPRCAM